ncbi:MAG: D-2-hydroxyacid dehydrogenase, partial [Candidatus Promineifilaceae bacterium]
MVKVVIAARYSPRLLEKLEAVSPELEIEQLELADNRWPEERQTEAEVYYAAGGPPRPEQAPNLRWLQSHWAGIDHLVSHPIWGSDVILTTTSGIHARNVGQYVLAQILVWANRVPRWLQYQARAEWPKERWQIFLPDELPDQTLGILGYGSIGREVARLAQAFGMSVLATKHDARHLEQRGFVMAGVGDPAGEMIDRLYPAEATRSMVAECDYVVVALPLTSHTRHFVDEELLQAMKPNCYLINIARGGVVDEAALIKALKKGWIAGAGLDVFE